ncbi:3D domain-containing protein [Sporosarcina obsidiansis]|uniref:3D domain-containing protein n=1 Tax=Sporosarcina obsidiansis TaxID=2660748 RepID=UPI001E497C2D|nr:3D domain-containing protein [Sporosarcina obsidiansis]
MKISLSLLAVLLFILAPLQVKAGELGKVRDGDNLFVDLVDKQVEAENYTVKDGDTLYRIAYNHGLSVETLMNLNRLTSNTIYPGDELIVVQESTNLKQGKKTKRTTPVVAVVDEKAATKEMTMTATAYTAYCEGCSGTTFTGQDLRTDPSQKVIAVDPKVIPIGSRVWVENYGEAIAGDIGGAIKGNKIDVFIPSHKRAMEWGVREVKIRILN